MQKPAGQSSQLCSVLQRVAACCSVLQYVAVCCSVLQCVAVCCSVLQSVAVRRSVAAIVGSAGNRLQNQFTTQSDDRDEF